MVGRGLSTQLDEEPHPSRCIEDQATLCTPSTSSLAHASTWSSPCSQPLILTLPQPGPCTSAKRTSDSDKEA